MTAAADLVLTNAKVHTFGSPDETHEAVAARDGEIVCVGRALDVGLLAGVETRVVDYGSRVVLPGFIDTHTHLPMVSRSLVHADFSAVGSPAEAVELLRERAAEVESDDETGGGADWVLGYGYDESTWDDLRYLTRDDLDAVSESRPVVTLREDVHTIGVNSVVLDESSWEADLIHDITASMTIVDGRVVFERNWTSNRHRRRRIFELSCSSDEQ